MFFFLDCRFVLDENINGTGISMFAIFDGHGGEFAADFAKAVLVKNLNLKLTQSSNIATGKTTPPAAVETPVKTAKACEDDDEDDDKDHEVNERHKVNAASSLTQRRQSFRKSKTEDVVDKVVSSGGNSGSNSGNTNANHKLETDLLSKYMGNASPQRQLTKENLINGTTGQQNANPKPKTYEAKCYVQNGSINYGKIITDEVLAADYDLVEMAKKVVCELTKLTDVVDAGIVQKLTFFTLSLHPVQLRRNDGADRGNAPHQANRGERRRFARRHV